MSLGKSHSWFFRAKQCIHPSVHTPVFSLPKLRAMAVAGSSLPLLSSPSSSPSLSFDASSSRLRAAVPGPPPAPSHGGGGGHARRPDPRKAWRICDGRPSTPSSSLLRWRRPVRRRVHAPSSMRACGSEEQGAAGHRGAASWGKERAANPLPASGFSRTCVACEASGYSQRSLPTAYRSKSMLRLFEFNGCMHAVLGSSWLLIASIYGQLS